jgi:hypothetical protein
LKGTNIQNPNSNFLGIWTLTSIRGVWIVAARKTFANYQNTQQQKVLKNPQIKEQHVD